VKQPGSLTCGSDGSSITISQSRIYQEQPMDEDQKTYRVRYEDGSASASAQRGSQLPKRTERFSSESEALKRAEELLGAGVDHGVLVLDDANALFLAFDSN